MSFDLAKQLVFMNAPLRSLPFSENLPFWRSMDSAFTRVAYFSDLRRPFEFVSDG